MIKPIGKGSYGEVFLVRHLVDRKQYVMKKIFLKKANGKEKNFAVQEVCLCSGLMASGWSPLRVMRASCSTLIVCR